MNVLSIEVDQKVREASEAHVIYLTSQLRMLPCDIILQYTGEEKSGAAIEDAIKRVYDFNMASAIKYGFIAL